MNRKVIVDVKNGKITKESKAELVCLKGEKINDDNNFIENLYITIKLDNALEKEYPLKISGYNFKLFIGNFCDEYVEDILVYGETGGTGNYAIANISFNWDKSNLGVKLLFGQECGAS